MHFEAEVTSIEALAHMLNLASVMCCDIFIIKFSSLASIVPYREHIA